MQRGLVKVLTRAVTCMSSLVLLMSTHISWWTFSLVSMVFEPPTNLTMVLMALPFLHFPKVLNM